MPLSYIRSVVVFFTLTDRISNGYNLIFLHIDHGILFHQSGIIFQRHKMGSALKYSKQRECRFGILSSAPWPSAEDMADSSVAPSLHRTSSPSYADSSGTNPTLDWSPVIKVHLYIPIHHHPAQDSCILSSYADNPSVPAHCLKIHASTYHNNHTAVSAYLRSTPGRSTPVHLDLIIFRLTCNGITWNHSSNCGTPNRLILNFFTGLISMEFRCHRSQNSKSHWRYKSDIWTGDDGKYCDWNDHWSYTSSLHPTSPVRYSVSPYRSWYMPEFLTLIREPFDQAGITQGRYSHGLILVVDLAPAPVIYLKLRDHICHTSHLLFPRIVAESLSSSGIWSNESSSISVNSPSSLSSASDIFRWRSEKTTVYLLHTRLLNCAKNPRTTFIPWILSAHICRTAFFAWKCCCHDHHDQKYPELRRMNIECRQCDIIVTLARITFYFFNTARFHFTFFMLIPFLKIISTLK